MPKSLCKRKRVKPNKCKKLRGCKVARGTKRTFCRKARNKTNKKRGTYKRKRTRGGGYPVEPWQLTLPGETFKISKINKLMKDLAIDGELDENQKKNFYDDLETLYKVKDSIEQDSGDPYSSDPYSSDPIIIETMERVKKKFGLDDVSYDSNNPAYVKFSSAIVSMAPKENN